MAYNTMNETKKTMNLDKLQGDIDFMLGLVTGIKRGKQRNKRRIKSTNYFKIRV